MRIKIKVTDPGRLRIYGRAIKAIRIVRRHKGTVTLALRARGRVRQHMNRRGWTRRKRIFVFYRSGGRRMKVRIVVRFFKQNRKRLSPQK